MRLKSFPLFSGQRRSVQYFSNVYLVLANEDGNNNKGLVIESKHCYTEGQCPLQNEVSEICL